MFKRRLFAFILAAAVLVTLCGCGGSAVVLKKAPAKSSTGSSWSVFVYMCGGGVSEDTLKENFTELMSTEYSENVNVIVQTGGREDWGIKGIDSEYNQRFVMQNKTMFLAGQTAKQNMASSDVLTDFLRWGTEKYPADRYILIVNGKGGGAMNGAAIDEMANDVLTLEDIYYSMSLIDTQMDIVGFDSSFMSSIETAAAIANYAGYMVASEGMICPYGFDYAALGRFLVNNPEETTEEVCRSICDDYYRKCDKYGAGDTATIAVTDLSRTTELTQAFDGMAGMMVYGVDNYDTGARILRRLTYLSASGANSPYEGYTDMADLKNLAETIQVDMGATADMLISAIDEIVLYSISGKARPYVKGLGVYYPFSRTAESINKYCKVFPSHNYLTFARKICANIETELGANEEDYRNTAAYYTYSDYVQNMQFSIYENYDGCYEIDIDGDMLLVKEIGLNVYSFDAETGECYKLRTSYDIDGDLDNTMFTADFPQKTISINGHNVYAVRVEKGYGYDIYSAPVLLNGEKADIRILRTYDDKSDKYKVIGVWSGISAETGLDGRDFRLLKTGDKITPLFELYGGIDMKEGKTFRIGITGAKAGMSAIKGGMAYNFAVNDMYGNIREGDMYIRSR